MLDLNYYMPVEIIYGKGVVKQNGARFAALGKRCLIVTGKHGAKACGALDDLTQTLDAAGVAYQIFDEIEPNPMESTCQKAGQAAKAMDADFLVGVGGGSPMDAVKAASVFACNDITLEELYQNSYSNSHLPFVCIGTSAGTGSEVTPYAILTQDFSGYKKSVKGLWPVFSLCDYSYTCTMGYQGSMSMALDALCHCVESYFSAKSNSITRKFAIAGAREVVGVFTDLPADGQFTDSQRQKLYAASIYGGLCIAKTGTCYCHAMGYFLSENHGVPHGVACAVFLPSFIQRSCDYLTKRANNFCYDLDFAPSRLKSLIENVTPKLDIHLSDEEKQALRQRFSAPGLFATSPGEFDADHAMELIEELFG